MLPSAKPRFIIDGKPVRAFLFARMIRVNGRQIPDMAQVEGFDVDHAWRRLLEHAPHTKRGEWEFLEELEPEHDVGYLGWKLPLLPNGASVPIVSPPSQH